MKTAKTTFSDKLMTVFHFVFFIVAGLITLSAVTLGLFFAPFFGEDGTEPNTPVLLGILRLLILLLFIGAVFLLFGVCLRFFTSDKLRRMDDGSFGTRLIFSAVGLILVVQLLSAFFLRMYPISDVAWLEAYAEKIISDGSFSCLDSEYGEHYIVWFPNNIATLLIYTLLYKLSYALTGTFSRVPILLFNTLCINAAVLLTVLTARRLFGMRKAAVTLVICALFAPYYTYTPYYYSDTFSIALVAGAVYAFAAATQCPKRGKKLLLLILCGAMCCVGYKIKGSVLVLLAALFIYSLLRYGIKRFIKIGGSVLLGFLIVYTSFTVAWKASGVISKESAEKYEFPLTHWAMMGLGMNGQYSEADFQYTKGFDGKDAKTEADIKVIGERIREYGPGGLAVHLWVKASWIYMDGSYNISHYLEHSVYDTPVHQIIIKGGKLRYLFFAYSFAIQSFLLCMMTYSGFAAFRKRRYELTAWLRIAVFGVFIFFSVWEANARYLFNFTPVYILLATEGLDDFVSTANKRKAKKNGKALLEKNS